MTDQRLDQLCINTIRTLAMDAVQAANSGHPGTPMAMAPVAYTLYNEVLRFDPEEASWVNRDRFVLSMGHASTLLYSTLHLAGVKQQDGGEELAVRLEDLKSFRQWGSRCPGHPEFGHTTGVETTTGPLGQGFASSVGMAMASKWLAARFNKPGFELFDFNVFSLGGDGCVMEGASTEAASLAAHLKLDNLCWIYDDNKITIEGETDLAFSEDVGSKFAAMGWRVVRVDDANDVGALRAAWEMAQQESSKPTLVIVKSEIGFGAPTKAGSHEAHGAPLGEEEIRGAKKSYGWDEEAKFHVPDEVRQVFAEGMGQRGAIKSRDWKKLLSEYQTAYPELYRELAQVLSDEPLSLAEVPEFESGQAVAGRAASGKALNAWAAQDPSVIGGSADLAPSTKTLLTFAGAGHFSAENYAGRNLHYGVRELAMACVMNGLATTGLRPYGSGFLVFCDYSRPAMRLAALMKLPVTYIFTHDSIFVGEDGPTHQPVEQLSSLRAMPGLTVLRPGDANEVSACYRLMAAQRRPWVLAASRQALPTFNRSVVASTAGVARGAYTLVDCAEVDSEEGAPELIILASGSELHLAVEAQKELADEGRRVRVVSMVSFELFAEQSKEYRDSVLPPSVECRLAVEAGVSQGWERWIGREGEALTMERFGESAPAGMMQEKFGFTTKRVLEASRRLLNNKTGGEPERSSSVPPSHSRRAAS